MIRADLHKYRQQDPRLKYRGTIASRVDNLTDAVFGIAITLLIFNLANPNSFDDLVGFAKTLPAFLLSISFLLLNRKEHLRFSEVYTLNDTRLVMVWPASMIWDKKLRQKSSFFELPQQNNTIKN